MSINIPIHPDQAAIVAALESGAATGAHQPLKRVDTHMSHLFLGPERAYKLKRSLRHSFADFSTLEARRRMCEAELEVNRDLAPTLYEGVLPIGRRGDGAIRVGEADRPIDWVVSMRRFDDGALLDEIAAAGGLTEGLITEAARVIAAFHERLPPRSEVGHTPDYHRTIEGLRRTEAEGAAAQGLGSASEPLLQRLERELARHMPLIEARRRAGFVRRGHGDLHLRNICLYQGRVTPFDALEFDPALATADVLYDVAFLFMDLRARGLDALANQAMNAYWDASRQPEEGLALLPLFMALRAAVRMAVSVEAGDLTQAAHYRGLGQALVQPGHTRLVAIGGLSGTGKSTLAKAVAARLGGPCGARILRTDVIRKLNAGAAPSERLTEQAYNAAARANICQILAERAQAALATHTPVVADATFQDAEFRASIERSAGVADFTGVWLRGSDAVRRARIAVRRGDISDATVEVALAQREPAQLGPAWRMLDADRTIAALASEVEETLGQHIAA